MSERFSRPYAVSKRYFDVIKEPLISYLEQGFMLKDVFKKFRQEGINVNPSPRAVKIKCANYSCIDSTLNFWASNGWIAKKKVGGNVAYALKPESLEQFVEPVKPPKIKKPKLPSKVKIIFDDLREVVFPYIEENKGANLFQIVDYLESNGFCEKYNLSYFSLSEYARNFLKSNKAEISIKRDRSFPHVAHKYFLKHQ